MPDIEIKEKNKSKLKLTEPKKWKVMMLNDDFTTMQFVISTLMNIFKHNEETAHGLMVQIHSEGSAIVGLYTFEIAEAKCVETTNIARNNGFPLVLKVVQE